MSLEKYRILVWKNLTIQKRHYISAIFEVIIPVIFVLLFTWLRSNFRYEDEQLYISNNTFGPAPTTEYCYSYDEYITKVAYSPTSAWTEQLLTTIFNVSNTEFESFDNALALDDYLVAVQPRNVLGIEFDDSLKV